MNRPLNADEPPSLCPDRTCRRLGLRLFRDRRGRHHRPSPHPPLRDSLPYRRRHLPRPHHPDLARGIPHQLETPNRGLANRRRLRSHWHARRRSRLPLDPENTGTLCPTGLLSLPSLRGLEIVDKITAPPPLLALIFSHRYAFPDCRVVQLVAHHTLNVGVLGSSPSAAAGRTIG